MEEGLWPFTSRSRRVKKFPTLFDIFSPSTSRKRTCIQWRAKTLPLNDSDCAISFSWCGNIRSSPPACRSKLSPRYSIDMAEHSICHPGRPRPIDVSQDVSPGFAAFQSAKSRAESFSYSYTSTRAPSSIPLRSFLLSLPYSGKDLRRKYQEPSSVL